MDFPNSERCSHPRNRVDFTPCGLLSVISPVSQSHDSWAVTDSACLIFCLLVSGLDPEPAITRSRTCGPRIDTPAGALYREGMEEYEAVARAAVAALQGANQPKWTDVLAAKTLIERTATRN